MNLPDRIRSLPFLANLRYHYGIGTTDIEAEIAALLADVLYEDRNAQAARRQEEKVAGLHVEEREPSAMK